MSVTPRNSQVGTLYPPVIQTIASTSGVVASGYGSFVGWEACTTYTPASFRFHDGVASSAVSPLGAQVIMAASTSTYRWYGPQGLPVASEVYVEFISGGAEITVFGQ